MSYELFLEWLSERGSGRWQSFVAAHEWIFNAGQRQVETTAPTWTARTLSDLGHLELDWGNRTWSVAPPLITVVPSAGARSLLTGGRTRTLVRKLDEETSPDATDDVIYERYEQDRAPDAVFLVSRDETVVEGLAQRLNIQYDYSAADRLNKALPALSNYLSVSESSPAPTGYEVRRFDASTFRWSSVNSDRSPGLYAYDVWGTARYRYISNIGVSHELDRAIGTYAELQRVGRSVLTWRANDVNGTLIVSAKAPLPTLQARVATACSGLTARYVAGNSTKHYVNVPLEIAERIASSLGQHLDQLQSDEGRRYA